ncbi:MULTISPECIES: hypothetical protein [Streptomyces]|uniref:hypothetical protein n=1 Tax=Streptomyces TaxID=1883 RepID=UPI0002DAB2AE|nr:MULTISPECIES: hypothetical protein [Streptomyces]MBP5861849.1 hypothetical protein [Streptomyces sp. LBUM 1484]KFG09743.1 hypothetical protein IQ61_06580 [Streptomyces scabiei]MBP5877695.1 hypothetical protein [Streptomyces sp. LBUM 1477]MBP5885532.1 hypothetical protein [Streptomyces sp. LBUM 1487]MBP5891641.1 hypothetical protein [Streptomyces sp. LBUM 1481]
MNAKHEAHGGRAGRDERTGWHATAPATGGRDGARRACAAVLATVTGVAVLAACGLEDHRETAGGGTATSAPPFTPKAPLPSGRPLGPDAHVPRPTGVDGTDATAVAEAWVQVAYGHDTKYDTGPRDAVLRSARWFTAARAKAERSYRPASGAGEQWNSWAAHEAWTTVDVEADDDGDAPADSARDAYRALFVDGTAHGRDGWTGTGPQATVYVKLVRPGKGEPWRVDGVRTVEAAVSAPDPSGSDSAAPSTTSPSARPE